MSSGNLILDKERSINKPDLIEYQGRGNGLHIKDNVNVATEHIDESHMSVNKILVYHEEDQINVCVHDAIKRMSRVRYKCMDIYKDFLAFGTSSGGIYLFGLGQFDRSACNLRAMIPCNAGSVEVIRFLPNTVDQDLLIAIGTSRGSMVIFRLTQLANADSEPFCSEIFKAESFTRNSSIKCIDFDQSYAIDTNYSLEGIYIGDSSNRIYKLDYSSMMKSMMKRSNSKQLLSPLLEIVDSRINQMSIYRNTLLISTNDNSRLYYEENRELFTIGSSRRREGCYGSCFYHPINMNQGLQQMTDSCVSLPVESNEPFMCFVARPNFRLWHVNYEREVTLTHQFEPRLSSRYSVPIAMSNQIITNLAEQDDPSELIKDLSMIGKSCGKPSTDHFERLFPIFTKTLGNLLFSYSRREIFIIDPIEADLVVWIRAEEDYEYVQVVAYENELFVWTNKRSNGEYSIRRLVLLAPTQMVLELHRLQKHLSLMAFVQFFAQLFRQLMALPLSNRNYIISTEGGLLRNVLVSSWSATAEVREKGELVSGKELLDTSLFERIIDEIRDESQQVKDSFYDLTNSRLFLTTSKENLNRLYSEPYTSLVTLQVSIASLHTEHVIHFDQETIDRHRRANLSQTLLTLHESKQRISMSNDHLKQNDGESESISENNNILQANGPETKPARAASQNCVYLNGNITGPLIDMNKLEASLNKRRTNRVVTDDARVMVVRKAPQKKVTSNTVQVSPLVTTKTPWRLDAPEMSAQDGDSRDSTRTLTSETHNHARTCFFADYIDEETVVDVSDIKLKEKKDDNRTKEEQATNTGNFRASESFEESFRCPKCRWPRERIHCHSLDSSKLIQLRWLESNLMKDFEKNLDEIERRAFEHGLWNLYLKCIIQRNELESYVTCSMMLDDVRLIDLDFLVSKTEIRDSQLCHRILDIMETKFDLRKRLIANSELRTKINDKSLICCLNCESTYESDKSKHHPIAGDMTHELELASIEDGFSFNLVNFFDQVLVRRFSDLQYVIQILLEHPKLIKESDIPSNFYLKVISTAILIGKQSALGQARLPQLSRRHRKHDQLSTQTYAP